MQAPNQLTADKSDDGTYGIRECDGRLEVGLHHARGVQQSLDPGTALCPKAARRSQQPQACYAEFLFHCQMDFCHRFEDRGRRPVAGPPRNMPKGYLQLESKYAPIGVVFLG